MHYAARTNRGNRAALKVIRDRYEALGFLDRALRLSMRIFVDAEEPDELSRIYPDYYWDQIVAAATEARVDPFLVLSVIRQESTFNEDAVSRAGALGLMQIMPQTGSKMADKLGMRSFERQSLFDVAASSMGASMRDLRIDATEVVHGHYPPDCHAGEQPPPRKSTNWLKERRRSHQQAQDALSASGAGGS